MGRYLLVSRIDDGPACEASAGALAKTAAARIGPVAPLNSRTWLATAGPHPPVLTPMGRWTLIGDVLHRRHPDLSTDRPSPDHDYERLLFARTWGRYVGVAFDRQGRPDALLRDPSGALDCITWTDRGLLFVASHAPAWLIEALRPAWRINPQRLAAALQDPVAPADALILDGPVAVLPGTVQPLPADTPAEAVWRPADIARRSLGPPLDVKPATDRLRAAIDEAVTGLAGLSGVEPLAAEVSGGLDSSLVAASLVQGRQDVRLWLNAVGADPEADERPWVEALGARLGFTPATVPHATAPLDQEQLLAGGGEFRPGLNGLDRAHDLDWARRLNDAGIRGLLTGKGGDSILLQRATEDVFADLWRQRGWRALFAPDVLELAAANERSIWSLIRHARSAGRRPWPLPRRDHPLLAPLAVAPPPHPWLTDLEAFGPAKAMQIAGVADSVSRHAPSVLTETVDVRHPLCAQPVIETCLALPAAVLTHGGRDRGLARLAFSDRLPRASLDRRSKGDMTRIYGGMILQNLPLLRPWLINGRLAALGLIDREAASEALTHEALLWRGSYSTILVAAAYEAWVRVWEDRLGSVSSSPDHLPA